MHPAEGCGPLFQSFLSQRLLQLCVCFTAVKIARLTRGGITLMHSPLFKFILDLNSVTFWKLLVFKLLLGIPEAFLCSMLTLRAKIILLLDVLKLLMMFLGTLTYLEPNYINHIL
jgi:hypothetical protein